jgi:hypothetical protein
MLVLSRSAMRCLPAAAAVLLTACAVSPGADSNGSTPVTAVPTREEVRAQNERDIEAARQALEWQRYVCTQPPEERKRLIAETREKYGWQLACPEKGT